MKELKINKKLQVTLNDFVKGLQKICADNLISVLLYGSGSSGEFTDKHSNLNLLVVLKDASLGNLKPVSGLVNKWRFRLIHPLFFTEEYIRNSIDVFPIEFLDMKDFLSRKIFTTPCPTLPKPIKPKLIFFMLTLS